MNLTNGTNLTTDIKHYIKFGEFDSKELDLHLSSRNAPTPQEKQIAVNIPFRHGSVDLSALGGKRIYENREITYTFYKFNIEQDKVNQLQTKIENALMAPSKDELHDNFDPDFHYVGKCINIETEDEYQQKILKFTITFELYPFKISNNLEGQKQYFVTESDDVEIICNEDGINPDIETNSAFTVSINGNDYSFGTGFYSSSRIQLKKGVNKLTLKGNGTIKFSWRKEVI